MNLYIVWLSVLLAFISISFGGSLCIAQPADLFLSGLRAPAKYTQSAFFVAQVVDAETSAPIKNFRVLAGTSRMSDIGWQWQSHTIYEFTNGTMQWPTPNKRGYSKQVLRIEADGYIPFHTPEIIQLRKGKVEKPRSAKDEPTPKILQGRKGNPASMVIALEHNRGLQGRVLLPNGQPAVGAQIGVGMAARTLRIKDGKIVAPKPLNENSTLRDKWSWPILTTSNDDGRFRVPDEIAPAALVITHESGIATLPISEFTANKDFTLEPWGVIDGRVMWGETPGANAKLDLSARTRLADKFHLVINHYQSVETDANGNFRVEKIPPGLMQVSHVIQAKGAQGKSYRPIQFYKVPSGESAPFIFGGLGRPIVGKMEGEFDPDHITIRIAPNAPHPGFLSNGQDPTWAAYGQFLASPEGKNYVKDSIKVKADGTFRIENVPPEYYQLFVKSTSFEGKATNVGFSKFRVETIPGGSSSEPQDIGTIKLRK